MNPKLHTYKQFAFDLRKMSTKSILEVVVDFFQRVIALFECAKNFGICQYYRLKAAWSGLKAMKGSSVMSQGLIEVIIK